tara:strand:+ start:3390 stop:4016 length:627 start_codon:yes stop_codon:yes gene_type:complete
MTLRVIGAGIGRTGTTSLKKALEQLLGEPCYHMHEVFFRPDDVAVWHAAAIGDMPDWGTFLKGFGAAIDWPASAYWESLAAAYPDALIILSTRADSETWWRSASNTILPASYAAEDSPWRRMVFAMFKHRFTQDVKNKTAAIAAYEAHNAHVRKTAPPARLLDWRAEQGWAPLCTALDLPVPKEPFPHDNTTSEFQERIGSGDPAPKH